MSSSPNKAVKAKEGELNRIEKLSNITKLIFLVNNNKRKRHEYKYGNYHNYYAKRLGAGEQPSDFRLEILESHPEYFREKKVLDIGCNSGFITINLAKKLLPASILGIDIDQSLIETARRLLQKEKTEDIPDDEKKALNNVIFIKVIKMNQTIRSHD